MRELFTTLFVFAAAFMLWRTVRPHRPNGYQMASSQTLHDSDLVDPRVYKWPALGLFQLNTSDSSRYQSTLRLVADGNPMGEVGVQVLAQLHTGGNSTEIWKPVEVRVHGERVGFLSSGDASRFLRRLAYEGRAGQTTCCDARITLTNNHYDIQLDLKEFRH
jgi:hypothetical protein